MRIVSNTCPMGARLPSREPSRYTCASIESLPNEWFHRVSTHDRGWRSRTCRRKLAFRQKSFLFRRVARGKKRLDTAPASRCIMQRLFEVLSFLSFLLAFLFFYSPARSSGNPRRRVPTAARPSILLSPFFSLFPLLSRSFGGAAAVTRRNCR